MGQLYRSSAYFAVLNIGEARLLGNTRSYCYLSRTPGGYLIIVMTACAAVDHAQFQSRFRAGSVS